MNSILLLENGKYFFGDSFGYNKLDNTIGEVVFNTATTGYQETLTDPSYYNQIVVETAAYIGNTGINFTDNESSKIWVKGFVVKNLSEISSNWQSKKSLNDYLKENKILGLKNVDTRALTIYIRDKGAMRGGIFRINDHNYLTSVEKKELLKKIRKSPKMEGQKLSKYVTIKKTKIIGKGKTIIALDLVIKKNSLQILKKSGAKVVVLSDKNLNINDILKHKPSGVFYSNGPGDPETAVLEVKVLKEILKRKIPFFGICFGNQLLGQSLGFKTKKLKFGHSGVNQPVMNMKTKKIEITAHNHGFSVDMPIGKIVKTSFGRVKCSYKNMNDGTVEGIKCLDIPAFSVQFHPEAAAGPHDASAIFD